MEVFHWSGVGIQVADRATETVPRGRLTGAKPDAVRVFGNFFHDNRHGAGEGYGVESSAGADVTIEQNVFDNNRHGVAGGSHNQVEGKVELDFSSYVLRDNLFLPRGSKHCLDYRGTFTIVFALILAAAGALVGALMRRLRGRRGKGMALTSGIGLVAGAVLGVIAGGWCWNTHQIDMHGDKSLTALFGLVRVSHLCCGAAGETMIIERNTVLYDDGLAIKIRGNPKDRAVVDRNVFKCEDRSCAIDQNGEPSWFGDDITKPVDVRPTNTFDTNPLGQLGRCNFAAAGDGLQDELMTTGVTWWAKSPKTAQWRYLNTMPDRLPQLRLADVDGDGVCDVVRPDGTFSKSGTAPFRPPNRP